MTSYETVIGLEVHAQLLTESKMFCGCSAKYASASPNTHVCPVCLGLPGAMPVMNRRAVQFTVMTGLALNCSIPSFSQFDRKNYPYPDLMKGYQISQFAWPLAIEGFLETEVDGQTSSVGILRVHLEEDTAKLTHITNVYDSCSLVDVNRSGVPLMEIVSKPDITSPAQARVYLMNLRTILQYLNVCTGSMEEGAFRVDANVSIRPEGATELGVKVEIKNMNSFRAVERALEYEVVRQAEVLASGGRIVQETRGWVEDRGETVSQRSKEYAHDYRYFPEPDLPPLRLSREWVERVKAGLPELPAARKARLMKEYALGEYEAGLLTVSRATADFFEESARLSENAKSSSTWITGELFRLLKQDNRDIGESPVSSAALAELLKLIDKGTVSSRTGKEILEEMYKSGKSASALVSEKGLSQISDVDELSAQVDKVVSANEKAVEDFRAGKEQALAFLVGQVMKLTRGKANPGVVNQLLREKLGSSR